MVAEKKDSGPDLTDDSPNLFSSEENSGSEDE